jgi:hypothetical protein
MRFSGEGKYILNIFKYILNINISILIFSVIFKHFLILERTSDINIIKK